MVALEMNHLLVNGTISADGDPQTLDDLRTAKADGGSGGHISLLFKKTDTAVFEFKNTTRISAVGGIGANNGLSGSGGRIVM